MRLIKTTRTYKNKAGETKKATLFFLEVEGVSKPIQIEPHTYGDKGSTYNALNLVAIYVKDYNK